VANIKKLKVIWICHFSNTEVRERLPLGKKGKLLEDFAPWITNMIQEFKQFTDIEVHIVAPHEGLNTIVHSFDSEGIHYHFFKTDMPILNRHWPRVFLLDEWTKYFFNRLLVSYLVKRINPDIINLIGAENAYYSSTVLGIKNIPVLISIQGMYSIDDRFKIHGKDILRSNIERKIYSENKYFGISAPYMPELIRRDSPNPIFFWNRYPLKVLRLNDAQAIIKEYDFTYFCRITPLKGPEDALRALVLVKKYKPDVTMRMMGPVGESYLNELKDKARELGIDQNVIFSGGYVLQEDMLKEAAKSKYYVLPTLIDTIPGTIFEAIYLGLPVVSYRVGDIPRLNTGETRVLLCDRGDIASLAQNMIRLLDEPQLGVDLSRKAKAFIEEWFDNRKLALNITDKYKAVLAHYHHNEPVPAHLLYENYMNNI